jgi:hypothetical protein
MPDFTRTGNLAVAAACNSGQMVAAARKCSTSSLRVLSRRGPHKRQM